MGVTSLTRIVFGTVRIVTTFEDHSVGMGFERREMVFAMLMQCSTELSIKG